MMVAAQFDQLGQPKLDGVPRILGTAMDNSHHHVGHWLRSVEGPQGMLVKARLLANRIHL
eukprot:CAMPEP_0115164234 /NCGR_PEP_ID=MMETSP0227-20121206/72932_1 /TAXON_ID=89957 /ORGANISM="Polarella glacialis, Strain CCMP 1383" /LENGTH=59 /DNA_ID=CAMNT_0002576589 /DNA_START=306 /DNA_END=485 /DNA_ORIENTATION=-